MIIYEVNLVIDEDILASFNHWLENHLQEMLKIDGFISADKFTKLADKGRISILYKVENRKKLDNYFKNEAERMRMEGLKKFGNKFSAERRNIKETD